jgi:hypothetical protein
VEEVAAVVLEEKGWDAWHAASRQSLCAAQAGLPPRLPSFPSLSSPTTRPKEPRSTPGARVPFVSL